jgi:hypothetical protein
MAKTRGQMVALTRQFMDAEDSDRWTDSLIVAVLGSVFEEEWSNILNAAPYYTFASRTVAQDVNGQIALTALNGGSGDAEQNYYRLLNVSDGNSNYTETRFQDVPLATSTNYYPPYGYAYYLAGDYIQCLPIGSGVQMTIAVNYKPTNIVDLVTDASVITFPEHDELLLAYAAAARLLNKGGAESNAAVVLSRMANEERVSMLDDLRRKTINPTRMAYPDVRGDWGTW